MNIKDTNIALVHDWFLKNSLGGAEKVTFIIDKLLEKKYQVKYTPNICRNGYRY